MTLPMPKNNGQAAYQGFIDANELIELVHDCDPVFVWERLEAWGPTRVAVIAILLAAGHSPDESLSEALEGVAA